MKRHTLLILGGATALGLLSVAVTASTTLSGSAPELALTLWPASSAAAARKAEVLTTTGDPGRMAEAGELARRALLRQPLDATAARTLSIVAAQTGRADDAEQMLALAEWLSRRDALTQVALIEAKVAKGDVVGALVHYDRAMRTSVSTRAILLPVLVPAADNPQIARQVATLLRGRPWWWQDFFDRYSQVGTNSASLAAITAALDFRPSVAAEAERLSIAINRLIGLGDVDRAGRLYARVRPGPGLAATLRDGGFENDAPLPPFEWTYVTSDERAGIREYRDGASGKVALSLTGTEAGIVARQLLTLAPGRYALSARIGETGADTAARPFVTLACLDTRPTSGVVLKTAVLPAAVRATAWWMAFEIPRSCRMQWLSISVSGNLDTTTTTPWIDDMRIARLP